jgi:HSP20 family protein
MKIINREVSRDFAPRVFRDTFSGLVGRLLDDDFFSVNLAGSGLDPKVDVFEKDNTIFVKADLPGVAEKDLDVELKDNVLSISGRKEEEHESDDKNYYKIERSYGSFTRSFALPDNLDKEKMSADYKKGVLTISIPKAKVSEPKKISIKVA